MRGNSDKNCELNVFNAFLHNRSFNYLYLFLANN